MSYRLQTMRKFSLLGVKIASISKKEALLSVNSWLENRSRINPHYLTTPNPEIIAAALHDAKLKEALNHSDLAIPDGIGLFYAARILGEEMKERITGTDFIEDLCRNFSHQTHTVGFLGAGEGIAKKAAGQLKKRYPGLRVAFSSGEMTTKKQKCDFLFVAYGAPKQEKFIYSLVKKMRQGKSVPVEFKVAMGVGGAFDYISGKVSRAPVLLRKLGLEWLWRLVKQPWRWKRILVATVYFSWLVFKGKLRIIKD